jgi:ketosteroid isomerase-like protein/quercetin dioxygenase-like cupin family protein
MKRTTRDFALVLFMAVAIATPAQTATSQTRDERAVRAASDAWQRYVAAQQVDSIVALHLPDAVMMLANTPALKGSDAVRAGWAEMVKLPGLNMHWTPVTIDVASPTVATEYGTYTDSYDGPNGKVSDSGTYVTIWHKVNGQWRVALDAPVSNMPAAAAAPAEASEFVARNPGTLTWSDFAPPGFPPGGKITVLHGDPSAAGRFVLRLNLPDGYQVPLHWHPTAEYVTVLSGAGQFGMGNSVDMSAAKTFSPGDFVFIPARHPHFLQTRGPTILQVSGNGPFQMNLGVPK